MSRYLTLIVVELLFSHTEVFPLPHYTLRISGFPHVCMDNITKCKHKIFFLSFSLEEIYLPGVEYFSGIYRCQAFIFFFTSSNGGRTISSGLSELLNNLIDVSTLFFKSRKQIILPKRFFSFQNSVGTTERLQQAIFHVLVDIERIQFFTIKTSVREHPPSQQRAKAVQAWFHDRLSSFMRRLMSS